MSTTQPPDEYGKKENEMDGFHNFPIIDTPWSWYSDHWWTYQDGKCADDEYYFVKCVGHVGVKRAPVECKKLHDDFVECAFRLRTVRLQIICLIHIFIIITCSQFTNLIVFTFLVV